MSKNDIIAKYMKSVNQPGKNSSIPQTNGQQQRQASGGPQNCGLISQYNNFMRSVANQQNLKNPILNQNSGGHSRNYQNQLGVSSKTHNESMIYHNNSSISGSFNNGMSQPVRGGHGITTGGSSRPITSSYTNNNASKL